MCDCDSPRKDAPTSLHEKFCRLTHGIPCRTVHAIMALILGRKTEGCGCGHHSEGEGAAGSCGCGGHGKSENASGSGCGCGGKH